MVDILHSLVSEQPTHLLFIAATGTQLAMSQTIARPFFDNDSTISWHSVSDTMFYCSSYYDLNTVQRMAAKMVHGIRIQEPRISIRFFVMQIAEDNQGS